MSEKYTFIDLFAGCGGLSEGFYLEGYKSLAHVEIDKYACETLKERMLYYNYSKEETENAVLCEDMTNPDLQEILSEKIQNQQVDLIIGGPPCQSFSSLGRAKDPNSMRYDNRNYLFENYMNILNHFLPKMFVFENVRGILSAKVDGEPIIDRIFDRMSENYKICRDVKKIVLNSVHYGVPQTRERVIIIGVRKDLDFTPEDVYDSIEKTHYDVEGYPNRNLQPYVTVAEAISDLPKLLPGEGEEFIAFKPEVTNRYLSKIRKPNCDFLYNHMARTHNTDDMERYRLMSLNHWTLGELYEKRPDLIHPTKKRLFNNSYVVQHAHLPGRTIIAHLYKDGNQFIHPAPEQMRTFTVREAARIQSFPDDFKFVGSRTQQYKQVGNAVPPLMAKQIAKSMKKFLKIKQGVTV